VLCWPLLGPGAGDGEVEPVLGRLWRLDFAVVVDLEAGPGAREPLTDGGHELDAAGLVDGIAPVVAVAAEPWTQQLCSRRDAPVERRGQQRERMRVRNDSVPPSRSSLRASVRKAVGSAHSTAPYSLIATSKAWSGSGVSSAIP
jgi:hypothetical protein